MNSSPVRLKVLEKQLHLLWQQSAERRGRLATQRGEKLRVLYPGRHSGQRGPDFRDAVLLLDGGRLVKGDVEIHVEASGWKSHGHQQDANYNGVVLHVVSQAQGREATLLQSKIEAPILVLEPSEKVQERNNVSNDSPLLSQWRSLSTEAQDGLLEEHGDLRFAAKSRGLAMEVDEVGEDEALYRGLMESLGYGDNRRAFQEVGKRLPYKSFAPLACEPQGTRFLAIRALLMDAGGFLEGLADGESREAKALLKRLPRPTLSAEGDYVVRRPKGGAPIEWNLFRIRPQNHPRRRLMGMAHLIDRHLERGLSRSLPDGFRDGGSDGLMKALTFPPYIGKGRASEMVLNVALPFLHARAQRARELSLARLALEAYRCFPATGDNRITREMRKLLGMEVKPERVDTARKQQGLIYLYRFWVAGAQNSLLSNGPDLVSYPGQCTK